ncbi:MAG TPA: DPP IV N-terminal domain-containing protein [Gemmatimonadaceae bacterium]|nr:DPP IV N-terminal domain-containing protein [Gemmatimonadaceae bacterium]
MRYRVTLLATLVALSPAAPRSLAAQQPRIITTADYARAEKFMGYYTSSLVFGGTVNPTWLSGDRFWYRTTTPNGEQFILVDPAHATREPAFNQAKVAAALSAASGTSYDANHLPFFSIDLSEDGRTVSFDAGARHYSCDVGGNHCADVGAATGRGGRGALGRGGRGRGGAPGQPPESLSPDGTKAVFIRDWNLYVRDIATGQVTQLTHDGVENFGYATDNAGWTSSDRPIVLWSPDSKQVATYQQDQRNDGDMYLVETRVGHPILHAWKYPLPGDSIITMIQRVIINVDDGKVTRLQMPPDQHRTSICDDISCGGTLTDAEWSPDSKTLAFLSTSRDHRDENLRVADAATGAVRDIMEEKVPDFFESGFDMVNWHYLPTSNEVIWYSQRSNWGHLYLYDLATGKLKNQITSGDWKVLQVLRVDQPNRRIFFTAAGREKGDPYFVHFYSVKFDGSDFRSLTPDSANHTVQLAPDGRYFVDTYSTPQTPAVSVLRDENGTLVAHLEKEDISRLLATGWKPPRTIIVKARDGKTDLYGLMFTPTHLDPARKYPIVNHIYPGPQTGSVGTRSFTPARGDDQALAELGFVVVEIDAMGTPMRSHSFQAEYYGKMGVDGGMPDQVTGMKQLAQRYKYIDISRAGIYGHSGGGLATADAMFRYPDFFKVGVSESGNHDQAEYEDDWGEKWQGLDVKLPDGTWSYDAQSNESVAKNLKGHLLLAHGTMDNNVPPYNTLLVVDSLIKYNKDFDLIMIPNKPHGYGDATNYMTRRRWDYFVRYLMGATPPHEYLMKPPANAFGRGR